jgi:hypothetical protein
MGRRKPRCSLCGRTGHNVRTCIIKRVKLPVGVEDYAALDELRAVTGRRVGIRELQMLQKLAVKDQRFRDKYIRKHGIRHWETYLQTRPSLRKKYVKVNGKYNLAGHKGLVSKYMGSGVKWANRAKHFIERGLPVPARFTSDNYYR